MNRVIMRNARIVEVRVDHDHKSIVIDSDSHGKAVIRVTDDLKIYEDEFFNEVLVEDLSINYPIYVYMYENSPMMLSEPPQFTPLLLVVAQNEDELYQRIDFFDKDLVSSDKQIRLNLDERIISLSYPNLIRELLVDKQLLVFYHASTRSIPAIVNPVKIIIL